MTIRRVPLLLLPLMAGCSGCDSGPSPEAAPAGADGSPTDAGKEASAGEASAKDASGEAGADAADASVDKVEPPMGDPVWKAVSDRVAGCAMERLDNATALKLFRWQACDSTENCEEAVFNPSLIAKTAQVRSRSSVNDDGSRTTAAIAYQSEDNSESGFFLTQEDGQVLAGYRTTTTPQENCRVYGSAVWKEKFGAQVGQIPEAGGKRIGGLLGALPSVSSVNHFEIIPIPPGNGPDQGSLGASRWLWTWYPDQLTSFSNSDGSGFLVFAHTSESILMLGQPSTTGDRFLFTVVERQGSGAEGYVGMSDGVSAPTRYVSAPAGSWAGAPSFANSHVVWARGINPKDVNLFDSVELWASQYSDDPAGLQPYKVDDFLYPSMPGEYVGGWGYYATRGLGDGSPRPRETVLWNLASKSKRSVFLNKDRELAAYPGISRSHLYVHAIRSSDMKARYLMRFVLGG